MSCDLLLSGDTEAYRGPTGQSSFPMDGTAWKVTVQVICCRWWVKTEFWGIGVSGNRETKRCSDQSQRSLSWIHGEDDGGFRTLR